ncbi:MAG: Asp-tRNA(Asn)/Glu-tRNA(Gln) amidotransferase subunit GatB [Bacteroidales bacterium]
MTNYKLVVGLEIHVQINIQEKAFSVETYECNAIPNSQTGLWSYACPGVMPSLSYQLIASAIKLGSVFSSDISNEIYFSRKNYFYPDMPKAYQLTQTNPICKGGYLRVFRSDKTFFNVDFKEVHIEEDSAKSNHNQKSSNLDFNRSGVALLEIVTEPDIYSSADAKDFLNELKRNIQFLQISECEMEKGSLRCDVNVSVISENHKYPRTEIKNLNSFSAVKKAIEIEYNRQCNLISLGNDLKEETLVYDARNKKTFSIRQKGEFMDYRFLPENDILPILITEEDICALIQIEGKMYADYFSSLIYKYQISYLRSREICQKKEYVELVLYFIEKGFEPKLVIKVLFGVLKDLIFCNNSEVYIDELESFLMNLEQSQVSDYILKKVFSARISRKDKLTNLLNEFIKEEKVPIFEEQKIILSKYLLYNFPEEINRYKAGEKKLLGFFIGKIRHIDGVEIDPSKIRVLLEEIL